VYDVDTTYHNIPVKVYHGFLLLSIYHFDSYFVGYVCSIIICTDNKFYKKVYMLCVTEASLPTFKC
jgi:predicted GNAT superfamily acetyltransferase